MILVIGLLMLGLFCLMSMSFADTAISTSHALKPVVISEQLFRMALKMMFVSKFAGKSADSMIQDNFDLSKQAGDQIKFGLRTKLQGAGRVDDDDMEGFEEPLEFYDWSTTVHERKNAVRLAGKLTEQRSIFNLREEAKLALADWTADLIDDDMVMALSGVANPAISDAAVAPSKTTGNTRIWYGGQTQAGVVAAVSTDAGITNAGTAHIFGSAVISVIKRKAMLCNPIIRPINVGGKKYFVMFIHPYQAKALKNDTAWLAAQKDANVRGEDNPIFSGALGVYDGVVLHEWDRILTRLGAGGTAATEYFDVRSASPDVCYNTVYVARALFCGAQAGVRAFAQKTDWSEKMFDYGKKYGVQTSMIYKAGKPVYNTNDFGVIAVDTAIVPD